MAMENKIPLQQLDGCINTYSGKKINLLDPRPEQICIRDIARGLSFNSHFGGQTPQFFSIAQHCMMVCDLLEPMFGRNPQLMMLGLLHDASEAYLGDMLKPLKVHLPKFKEIEDRMMAVVMKKYQLNPDMIPMIKEADVQAQKVEYNAFYGDGHLPKMSPESAKSNFMRYYYIYLNQREYQNAENVGV